MEKYAQWKLGMLSVNKTEEMSKTNTIQGVKEIAKSLLSPVEFDSKKTTSSMLKTIKRLENRLNMELTSPPVPNTYNCTNHM